MLEINVSTPSREVLVDITKSVQQALSELRPDLDGTVVVYVPHTTAGMTINEGPDPSVARDILARLQALVPRNAGYAHGEGNSDAHIKASMLGSSVTVPVEGGHLRLGTWQSVYLAEFDGPRSRRVWILPLSAGT